MGSPLVNLTTKLISLTKKQLEIIQDFDVRFESFQKHNEIANLFIETGEKLIRNTNQKLYEQFSEQKKLLEKEITFSLRFLSQEEAEEGKESELLSEEKEADKAVLQILETESAELWRNLKLLREGEVKYALEEFLEELGREKEELVKEQKINNYIETLLKGLAAIIEEEQRELELELSLLQQKCTFSYSEFNEFKKAELSTTLEMLDKNIKNLENLLKREQGRFINPYKVFTNQKYIVTKKILNFAKKGVITRAMVKEDLRSLNPIQAQEYLEQLLKHYEQFEQASVKYFYRFKHFFYVKSKGIEAKEKALNTATVANLRRQAKYDPLTQVANRRLANEILAERIWLALKQGGRISIFLIDVDYFKKINDEYGHRAGDIVLVQLASILNSFFAPPHDLVSRWGGEEFLVIFAPTTLPEEAEQHAEKIRGILGKEIKESISKHPEEDIGIADLKKDVQSGKKLITISGGVASIDLKPKRFPEKEDTQKIMAMLTQAADDKLYEAKRSGRNAIHSVRLEA
ncbi:MAG: GGDEF domain-containing protein [bacterium]|nr:GGDEF domain-containing protein [bacterium]